MRMKDYTAFICGEGRIRAPSEDAHRYGCRKRYEHF